MSNQRITPFVKRMRGNGGTIFAFNSATEDIGISINERQNKVKISHFALLNIPNIAESSTGIYNNTFNIRNIAGMMEYERNSTSIKDGRVLIAESFQNYALNLESNLLNQTSYNPELHATVTERVFWKWLKETGAVRWMPDVSANGTQYWVEENETPQPGITHNVTYSKVVKYVGQVSAGAVRMDSFGTYNETYIMVPTSHGQTKAYFKQLEDDNYKHGMIIGELGENILGREGYTKPHPDALDFTAYYDLVDSSTYLYGGANEYLLKYDPSVGVFSPGWWYSAYNLNPQATYTDNIYLTDLSAYLTTKIYHTNLFYEASGGGNSVYFRRSNLDCVTLELDLQQLKSIYADTALTWDKIAIEDSISDAFYFNTVLIYYTVYNSTMDEVLATNLLGVMFLDAPSGNSSYITTGGVGITLPSLEKIMSTATGFGTSYSLRLNIKTDNILDNTTAVIVDEATSDQLYAEDWNEVFYNLERSVNILSQQNATMSYIYDQYSEMKETQTELVNDLTELEYVVDDIGRDITGTENTVPLFSSGDDPLIDSSIYMKNGRIGIFTNDPKYSLHIDSSMKVRDIILESAIRDVSQNVLLSYGSPLQIGASTNNRSIEFYSGDRNYIMRLDSSKNVYIDGSLHVYGDFAMNKFNVGNTKINAVYPDVSSGSASFTPLIYTHGIKLQSPTTVYKETDYIFLYYRNLTDGGLYFRKGNSASHLRQNHTSLEFLVNNQKVVKFSTSQIDISVNDIRIAPILPNTITTNVLYYNTTTGVVTYGKNMFSADSSVVGDFDVINGMFKGYISSATLEPGYFEQKNSLGPGFRVKSAATGAYSILKVDNGNGTVFDVQGDRIISNQPSIYFTGLSLGGGTQYLRWTSTGTPAGQVVVQTSDIKFKKDVKEWKIDALSVLSRFEPKQFIFKSDKDNNIRTGWIAQEGVEFIPDMFPYMEKEKAYTIVETEILPYLHKGVMQLKKENEDLKRTIEKLSSEIKEIKAKLI